MKLIIDPFDIKKAIKEGQLTFFVCEQYDGSYIYCKDLNTEECACVGKVKAESEVDNV